jgi:hypothetical protein
MENRIMFSLEFFTEKTEICFPVNLIGAFGEFF